MRVGNFDFSPRLVPTLATISLLPLLLTLGVWQLGRAAEKREMRQVYDQRATDAPLRLDADRWRLLHDRATVDELAYARVKMRGRFETRRQYLLDNRTHNGVAGFEVLTAFIPEGASGGLMVKRGWIPLTGRRDSLPSLPVPEESVKVSGLFDMQRRPLPLLGPSGYEQHEWPKVVQRIELESMSEQLGIPLLPSVLLLDSGAPAGFVREWKPYYGIPASRHQGYAVQWFALALALAVIYVVVNTRRASDD